MLYKRAPSIAEESLAHMNSSRALLFRQEGFKKPCGIYDADHPSEATVELFRGENCKTEVSEACCGS
jgi:hypothetical protein